MHFLFTFARTKVDRHVKIVIYNYHKDEDTGDRMHARKTSSQLYSLTQPFHVAVGHVVGKDDDGDAK